MTVATILMGAKALILDPADWNQGYRNTDRAGRPTMCLLGALDASVEASEPENYKTTVKAYSVLADTILENIGPDDVDFVDTFNGISGTSLERAKEEDGASILAWYNNTHQHDRVIDVLDKAVTKAEALESAQAAFGEPTA